jgi:potassium efflux system protein
MKSSAISLSFIFHFLLFNFLVFSLLAHDQADTLQIAQKDTIGFVKKFRDLGIKEAKRSIIKYNLEKESIKQQDLIEKIRIATQKANAYLKAGIDTLAIKNELSSIKTWIDFAGDGVFVNEGTAHSFRNLTTTYKLLDELLYRVTARKKQVDAYHKKLVHYRLQIDSLSADSILYDFPTDSVLMSRYLKQIVVVAKEIGPADTSLTLAIDNSNQIQTELNQMVNSLKYKLELIQEFQEKLAAKDLNREFANLGDTIGYNRPFPEVLYFSAVKAKLNLSFYAQNNIGRISIVLLLVVAMALFLRSLRRITGAIDTELTAVNNGLVLRYPLLSANVIILGLTQFAFVDPPFIFNCIFWIISAVSLSFVLDGHIKRYWQMVWLVFVFLFIIACANNLVLQASRIERWFMIILAGTGVIFGSFVLLNGRKKDLKEGLILYFIAFMVILELFSILANVYGRYNFSKTLLISGYLNVIIGILFLWIVRLINEALFLASSVYTKQERKLFYINFDRVGERASPMFYFLLVIGWFILIGRSFYLFRLISEPLKGLFLAERTIGNYTFTINNLLIFFLIIFVSLLTSKIVSYFASEQELAGSNGVKKRKAGVGSWLLLIRVSIMGLGTFLALAAAGFPMDKIAYIVGALGVGIGFGLQTLVNNLVSGLIIAFEKPVNVGDIVEISGQGGVVKSIGFRSSVISKWDGPDMVIPNGDLLNAHLINWTLAGSKRQIEILLTVAQGTDLNKTVEIINELLSKDSRVYEHPAPAVLFQTLNGSSVQLKVQFWVKDFKQGSLVSSDTIFAIDKLFKENGIIMPVQQQVILADAHKMAASKTAKK